MQARVSLPRDSKVVAAREKEVERILRSSSTSDGSNAVINYIARASILKQLQFIYPPQFVDVRESLNFAATLCFRNFSELSEISRFSREKRGGRSLSWTVQYFDVAEHS